MPPTPPHRLIPFVLLVAAIGCDGPATVAQRLEGDWVGRPETAAERTIREWPTRKIDPDDPEIAAAAAVAVPTDLEAAADAEVEMRLHDSGKARLSLDGAQPLEGVWSVTPIEGRRVQLEIAIDGAEESEAPAPRRRFEVEFLPEGEAFVLREQGADRMFGRLLFRHAGQRSGAE